MAASTGEDNAHACYTLAPQMSRAPATLLAIAWCVCGAVPLSAQAPSDPQAQAVHEHDVGGADGWKWMYDGAFFLTFNRQGGDRGSREFKSQNWLMMMASRRLGRGDLTLTGMLTAEPLTQTARGYAQLFQSGESYNGLENIDFQHPHEIVSQLAAIWRVPIRGSTGVFVSGAPVGEATLGPVAFMHRPSASDNPTAPLAHHSLDSSHITHGVIAAGINHRVWTVEGSLFRGREPDQHRYGLEAGALDSWAARVWFRPAPALSAQVSYGFLKQPERLEPGDIRRATASVSWKRQRDSSLLAVTAAVGRNAKIFDTNTTAFLSEATVRRGANSVYTRVEVLQVTSEHLMFPTILHRPHPAETIDVLKAFTGGFVREIPSPKAVQVGLGADVTLYGVPARLQSSNQFTMYGSRPVSAHVFLRIRPGVAAMGDIGSSGHRMAAVAP